MPSPPLPGLPQRAISLHLHAPSPRTAARATCATTPPLPSRNLGLACYRHHLALIFCSHTFTPRIYSFTQHFTLMHHVVLLYPYRSIVSFLPTFRASPLAPHLPSRLTTPHALYLLYYTSPSATPPCTHFTPATTHCLPSSAAPYLPPHTCLHCLSRHHHTPAHCLLSPSGSTSLASSFLSRALSSIVAALPPSPYIYL